MTPLLLYRARYLLTLLHRMDRAAKETRLLSGERLKGHANMTKLLAQTDQASLQEAFGPPARAREMVTQNSVKRELLIAFSRCSTVLR